MGGPMQKRIDSYLSPLWVVATCAVLVSPVSALAADARAYPDRPIRLIDPYAPGGGSGVIARFLSQKMSEAWGRQIVVDNRPGAAGAIGTEIAVRASPDGYTLLMGTSGSIGISPNMNKLSYDPVKDLTAISQTSSQVMLVVLHPSLPVNSVKELIVYAKAQPGKLVYASSGTGGSGHLATELFQSITKTSMIHVPYKGNGAAVVAQLSGEVQLGFNNILSVFPHVSGGKLKAIGVTSAKRAPSVPTVPTLMESGVTGYEAVSWNGVFAPAQTPRPIIDKINAEIVKAIAIPDVRDKLIAMGSDPTTSTPEAFQAFIKLELARWGKVIKDNNIRSE
jgi:tripartite-type tricarboxylate transporter receptor subunit TctC